MASVAELKDAVKDTLERKGALRGLQSAVRSQVFKILLEAEEEARPEPCDESLVVNELIREYLIFNGLRDTLSVFIPESGQPAARPFNREFLARHLCIADAPHTQQVPLLYALAARSQSQAAGGPPQQPQPKQQPAAAGEQQRALEPPTQLPPAAADG
ncbi:hypothetical protein HT031_000416 [Scenedesmus sp. PABB004]|nr:hypothetical protein HT031_000416 [Scenedesmus sp. PABB004]